MDTTINDLAQSAVVRVIATHTYDEIIARIADGSITHTLTKEVRRPPTNWLGCPSAGAPSGPDDGGRRFVQWSD